MRLNASAISEGFEWLSSKPGRPLIIAGRAIHDAHMNQNLHLSKRYLFSGRPQTLAFAAMRSPQNAASSAPRPGGPFRKPEEKLKSRCNISASSPIRNRKVSTLMITWHDCSQTRLRCLLRCERLTTPGYPRCRKLPGTVIPTRPTRESALSLTRTDDLPKRDEQPRFFPCFWMPGPALYRRQHDGEHMQYQAHGAPDTAKPFWEMVGGRELDKVVCCICSGNLRNEARRADLSATAVSGPAIFSI